MFLVKLWKFINEQMMLLITTLFHSWIVKLMVDIVYKALILYE